MPFPTAPSAPQIALMQAGGYSLKQRLLIVPNTVVFSASLTGFTQTNGYAQVSFDTVTTGAFTDIKEGFTIAISSASNFEDVPESNIFRVRADNSGVVSTASTININRTSAALSDGMTILVIKDIREETKEPYINDTNTYFKDFAIEFRRLLPVQTALDTVYVAALDSGQVDITFPSEWQITDADATTSLTYLTDSDGATFVSSTSASQQPTLRFTSSGHYMPRFRATD
ncbi:MAG TPA: hypothetical protein VKP88_05155, partial [Candidatus Paceibacterota bacterium]|nr:hypothetical protein [Candidatus Paceibacterota bacterium]